MIYKTLKKVSNVCQLLDKSKYPATQTISGVTFTNNGDGSITVNGTATEDVYISSGAVGVIKGHKYLWKGTPVGGASSTFHSYTFGRMEQFFIDTGSGTISTAKEDGFTYTVLARVMFSTTVSNLVFKPQFFDLTEMYGSGNEPTTVEQFRQDFPDEMYDYKPYCFVKSYKTLLKATDDKIITSYKKSLICTTKNLLPYPYYETTITRNGITFTDNRDGTITANGTSTGFATFVFSKNYNFIAGNTYYVSTQYGIIAYKENGTIYYIGNESFTWSSNWEVVQIYMQIKKGITLNNLKIYPMINLGSTATEYHPYGYL